MRQKIISFLTLAAMTLLSQGAWGQDILSPDLTGVSYRLITTGEFGTNTSGNTYSKDDVTYEKSGVNNTDDNHSPKWWKMNGTDRYIGCPLANALQVGDKIVITGRASATSCKFLLRTTNSTSEEAAVTLTATDTKGETFTYTVEKGNNLEGKSKFYLMISAANNMYVASISVASGFASTPSVISANKEWDMTAFDVIAATTTDLVNDKMLYGTGVSVENKTSIKDTDGSTYFSGQLLQLGGNHNGGFNAANGHYVMFKLPANVSGKLSAIVFPNGSSSKTLSYKIGETVTTLSSSAGNTKLLNTEEKDFSTTEETPLYIYVSSNHGSYYIKSITLTFTTPIVTLDDYGYATFASTSELDLTTASMVDGVNAYKASVSGTTVNFSDVNAKVQANTGVLFKGSANQVFGIKLATGEGTDISGSNAFLVNEGGTTFDGDNDYYYFAMKKNQATLTFGTFTPSTLAIPANKAYLKVAKTNFNNSAPALSFTFDDDNQATGIGNLTPTLSKGEGVVYNLNGQRVAQPTRGLYIVNGKKVIIK